MSYLIYEKLESGYQLQGQGRVLYDLVYDHQSSMQTLDLYLPANVAAAAPIVMFIHGGAFAKGDKSRHLGGVLQALQRGYAVASVNYRLNQEACYPACLFDSAKALCFLKEHASEYQLDASRIVLWGDTHGGYLASKLAIDGVKGLLELPQKESQALAVQGVISFYAPIDLCDFYQRQMDQDQFIVINQRIADELTFGKSGHELLAFLKEIDPLPHIDGSEPSFYLLHGCQDHQIPHAYTKSFAQALQTAGVPHQVAWVEDGIHGIDFYDQECYNEPIMKFIDTCFAKKG